MKKFFGLYNAAKEQIVEAVKVYVQARGGKVICDDSKTIKVDEESEEDSKGNPMPMLLRVKYIDIYEDSVFVMLDDLGRDWYEYLRGFGIDTIFEMLDTIKD